MDRHVRLIEGMVGRRVRDHAHLSDLNTLSSQCSLANEACERKDEQSRGRHSLSGLRAVSGASSFPVALSSSFGINQMARYGVRDIAVPGLGVSYLIPGPDLIVIVGK